MSCCSAATAEALEFPALLAVLAGFASTDAGVRAVRSIEPETDAEEIDRRRLRYAEIAGEVERGGALAPSLDGLLELRGHLEGDGRGLAGPHLLDLAAAIEASEEVLARLENAETTPRCAAEVETLRLMETGAGDAPAGDTAAPHTAAAGAAAPGRTGGGCAGLASRLRRMLDRRGEVRDDATPRLRTLVRDARRTQASVEASLQAYVRRHGHALADDSTPMRGGRLSVLLPSGSRGRLAGLVRGRSASGRSFYFEPAETVEGNDELERIASDREIERTRILAELAGQARRLAPAIVARIDHLAAVDAMQAAARFAVEVDAALAAVAAVAADDDAAGAAPLLKLRSARHPLLDPRLADRREQALGAAGNRGAAVPLDLKLDEHRTLVLTGPNAGGKTVALKTVGLLCLMNQAGLPVPAAPESRLPILDHVVAVVGDEQSVLDEQSTFSARLLRLREVWRRAGPGALVLLDEVGAGTNPEEGAALGIALLEGLVERGSLGILTTHLTQLAAAALESRAASCAAMGFDPENGLPTYRLALGPPGGSQALALARRLGLPPAWLERAEHFLGSEHQKLRRVLERNERLRERLLEREADLARLTGETEAARARFETRQESLRAARRRLDRALDREVDSLRRANRRRLDEALAELSSARQGPGGQRPGKRAFARAAASLHGELDRDRSAAANRASEAAAARTSDPAGDLASDATAAGASPSVSRPPLVAGVRVRHRSLGWQGELAELRAGQAIVLVRGKRVRAPGADLVAVAGDQRPSQGRVQVQRSQAGPVEAELLLIGQLVEPALESLDAYLDRALAAGRERVRVVHGHGSGRLRRAVRAHLRDHPAVAGFNPAPPSAGGDGATEVLLR